MECRIGISVRCLPRALELTPPRLVRLTVSSVSSHTKRSPSAAAPTAPSAWCQNEDCLPLGLDADLYNLKGTFTVLTADHAPYCRTLRRSERFLYKYLLQPTALAFCAAKVHLRQPYAV